MTFGDPHVMWEQRVAYGISQPFTTQRAEVAPGVHVEGTPGQVQEILVWIVEQGGCTVEALQELVGEQNREDGFDDK